MENVINKTIEEINENKRLTDGYLTILELWRKTNLDRVGLAYMTGIYTSYAFDENNKFVFINPDECKEEKDHIQFENTPYHFCPDCGFIYTF